MSGEIQKKVKRNTCHQLFYTMAELPNSLEEYVVNTYIRNKHHPEETTNIYVLFDDSHPAIDITLPTLRNYIRTEHTYGRILYTFRCPDYFIDDYNLIIRNDGRSLYSKTSHKFKSKFEMFTEVIRNGSVIKTRTGWDVVFNPTHADKIRNVLDEYNIKLSDVDIEDIEVMRPVDINTNTFE